MRWRWARAVWISACDGDTADKVFALMLQLAHEQRMAFVLVTHDRDLAARCDRTLTLAGGHLTQG